MKTPKLMAAIVFSLIASWASAAEIDTWIPDYKASTLATLKEPINGLAVDSDGLLYVLTYSGIFRFSVTGELELWSTAVGFGLGFTSDGIGFLTPRGLSNSILKIEKDGTWKTFATVPQEALGWSYISVASEGPLFAVGQSFGRLAQVLAEIDLSSGNATIVSSFDARSVEMGASPPGFVFSLLAGPAGSIYVVGTGKSSVGLYRSTRGDLPFKKVADFPGVVFYTAIDDKGVIYGASSEGDYGTVLRIDPVTGIVDPLASGFKSVPSLAFDRKTQRLFAAEQGAPYTITAISVPPDACVPSPRAVIRTSEVEIAWPTQSNRVYRVEFREKLKSEDSWSVLFTNLLGQGTPISVHDKVPAAQPERLYRILCETNQVNGKP